MVNQRPKTTARSGPKGLSGPEPEAVRLKPFGVCFVSVGFGTSKERVWRREDRGEEGDYPALCDTSHGADASICGVASVSVRDHVDAEAKTAEPKRVPLLGVRHEAPVQSRSGAEGFVAALPVADNLAPR